MGCWLLGCFSLTLCFLASWRLRGSTEGLRGSIEIKKKPWTVARAHAIHVGRSVIFLILLLSPEDAIKEGLLLFRFIYFRAYLRIFLIGCIFFLVDILSVFILHRF